MNLAMWPHTLHRVNTKYAQRNWMVRLVCLLDLLNLRLLNFVFLLYFGGAHCIAGTLSGMLHSLFDCSENHAGDTVPILLMKKQKLQGIQSLVQLPRKPAWWLLLFPLHHSCCCCEPGLWNVCQTWKHSSTTGPLHLLPFGPKMLSSLLFIYSLLSKKNLFIWLHWVFVEAHRIFLASCRIFCYGTRALEQWARRPRSCSTWA